MPKKKIELVKEKITPAPKIVEDIDEEKMIDPDGILGDDAPEDDEEMTMDDDEVDPFGDKWEQ